MQTELLGGVVELKANKLMNERTFRRIPEKRELLVRMFEWIRDEAPIQVFALTMPRPKVTPAEHKGHLSWPHRFLLMRLQACLAERYRGDQGILVFDTQDPDSDLVISRNISNFFFRSLDGRRYDLLDTAFFVDSRIAPGIQIADLIAGAIRLYHHLNLGRREAQNGFELGLQNFYAAARSRTVDFQEGVVPDFGAGELTGFCEIEEKWLHE